MSIGKKYEPPIGPVEVFLIEMVIYMGLWMLDDYLATMVSVILSCICLVLLITALGMELIERTRVPRWYYYFMAASVIAPILSGLIYYFITGQLDWVVNPFS